MTEQRFLDSDGVPLGYVSLFNEQGEISPDHFNALRFLLAFLDGDRVEMEAVLREARALPLLGGLGSLALGFGRHLAGGDDSVFRDQLNLMANNPELDAAGTSDAYRARRFPSTTDTDSGTRRAER